MKALQVFNYRGNNIRTVTVDNEPWVNAGDVCQVLELGNVSHAVSKLDEDEKGLILSDTPGGKQKLLFVNEPGLYSLILTSRKSEARNFKRWITHEVIPQIRKTGSYSVQSPTEALLQAVTILHDQEKRLAQLEANQEHIRDTIAYQPDNWRADMNRLFNKIVEKIGREKFAELRRETYKRLEERARVDLDRRLDNLKDRLVQSGATATAVLKANRMDVIEADPKLREIYAIILKQLAIQGVA